MSEDKRENLEKLLSTITVAKEPENCFLELCYTASETGILPFDIKDDCSEIIMKLVWLAATYGDVKNIPPNVRM